MIKHYLKIAYRNLLRDKLYSLINIFGLAVSMAASILIFGYVEHEYSFDKFHKKKDQIYLVNHSVSTADGIQTGRKYFTGCRQSVLENFQEVEEVARYNKLKGKANNVTLKSGDNVFSERYVIFSDNSFFKVFDFEIIDGNRENPLTQPNSIVFTRSMATKYFGDRSPIGETVIFEGAIPLVVTAVMEDLPSNSHFKINFMIPTGMMSTYFAEVKGWKGWDTEKYLNQFKGRIYFLLKPDTDPSRLEHKLSYLVDTFHDKRLNQEEWLSLEPLKDIHYNNPENNQAQTNGLLIAGILILFIACINFINLATAKSMKRAKEVGVRKAIGAQRNQLVRQFLGESLILSLISMSIALLLADLFLPLMNDISHQGLVFSELISKPIIASSAFTIVLLVGFLGGLYPAFYLSGFVMRLGINPLLKGSNVSLIIRNGLVTAQLTISLVLIVSITLLYLQMDYINNQDMGYDKEHLIHLKGGLTGSQEIIHRRDRLIETLNSSPLIKSACAGTIPISQGGTQLFWNQSEDKSEASKFVRLYVGLDYVKTAGMKLIAGRDFEKGREDPYRWGNFPTIINETAAKSLGWELPYPTDKKIHLLGDYDGRDTIFTCPVVGIVKDFHHNTLHSPVEPLAMTCYAEFTSVLVRVDGENMKNALSFMEEAKAEIFPDREIKVSFVEQSLEYNYTKDKDTLLLVSIFAFLAIVISCLGMVGLVAYTIEQRMKEIAIRRVVGASVRAIVRLLNGAFVRLFAYATFIGLPLAYFLVTFWLDNFAYRIDLELWYFLTPAITLVVLTLLVISYFTAKTAFAKPTMMLRNE